jgi:hypothetical protein
VEKLANDIATTLAVQCVMPPPKALAASLASGADLTFATLLAAKS